MTITSKRVITISYTGRDAAGGVPRWNRDFESCFPNHNVVHFCWSDFPGYRGEANNHWEFDKAQILNAYLKQTRKVTKDDIIVADGFWLTGFENFPKTVSVAHGIWSHLTHAEALAGKSPENPMLHKAQLKFRKQYQSMGGKIIAVSDFIKDQMELQFGIKSEVIGNAVDLNSCKPYSEYSNRLGDKRELEYFHIIHGVNDKGNYNKGWDHIEFLEQNISSLQDELRKTGNKQEIAINNLSDYFGSDEDMKKVREFVTSPQQALAGASLVVIPSGYEGNSFFCLESLSCDIPVVAYSVGLPYTLRDKIGIVLDREKRNKYEFLEGVKQALGLLGNWSPRHVVKPYSIENFRKNWNEYFRKFGWL